MARNPNDLYPTPPCAAFALAYALSTYLGVRLASRDVLDPAAGFGTLLEWCGVPRTRRELDSKEWHCDCGTWLIETPHATRRVATKLDDVLVRIDMERAR